MNRWDGKSKGTLSGYKIFIFSIKTFGVGFAYALSRIVANYFFFFSKHNRVALIDFYTTALNYKYKKALQLTNLNFYRFGQTLIDRYAFLLGQSDKYTYSFDHEDYLLGIRNNGKGGILLSAHLGNWETAGNLLCKRNIY